VIDQPGSFLAQLVAIPGRQQALTLLQGGSWPEEQNEMCGVNLNPGRGIHFLKVQQQPLAPEGMGFPLHHQPGALARLRLSSITPMAMPFT
jgi:hypothetical protein